MIELDKILKSHFPNYFRYGDHDKDVHKSAMREAIKQALELAANDVGYTQYIGKSGYPVCEVDKQSILNIINKVV